MKKVYLTAFIALLLSLTIFVSASNSSNNKSKTYDENMQIVETFNNNEFNLLVENDSYGFYYKPSLDILKITNKDTGYEWLSGVNIDTAYSSNNKFSSKMLEYKKAIENNESQDKIDTLYQEMQELAKVSGSALNDDAITRANSLLHIEYFDNKVAKNLYTANLTVDTQRVVLSDSKDSNHFAFRYIFSSAKIEMNIHFYFSENGLTYQIRDEQITGDNNENLSQISVMPYLGAEGGITKNYTYEEKEEDGIQKYYRVETTTEVNDLTEGYTLIPDGSGALVKNIAHTQKFDAIKLEVYGENKSTNENSTTQQSNYNDDFYASMPVFGMSKPNDGFVSFTTEGDAYMSINAEPYGNGNISYTRGYASYNYNNYFSQILNDNGASVSAVQENRYNYDVVNTINFLDGDVSYLGMADSYANYLSSNDLILKSKNINGDIPLHIDFVMADSKEAVFGYSTVVVTSVSQVDTILNELIESGITNINASLLGFEDGGITLASKTKVSYSSNIGKEKDIKNLITKYAAKGIDISCTFDYYEINSEVINSYGNATKHLNGVYTTEQQINNTVFKDIMYLRPDKAYSYANSTLPSFISKTNSSSITLSGITNNKISHYTNEVESDLNYYENILKLSSDKANVNAVTPNSYLYPYVTRYLNANPFNSNFVIASEVVPFVSYLLSPYMEVYADYANFSFSKQEDILRMIDFNMFPSFLLSYESSHLLADTNSNRFFSTQYSSNSSVVSNVYNGVNDILSEVSNLTWIDRTVENGLVVNTYIDNTKTVKIVINYNETSSLFYNGKEVKSLSCEVIK